ncbi:GAF domain-containing sensor histidine kinase [Mycolicibacterium stellerae]|uniref:GAF domain-containing sensor histidine kinase n=1 Tax=Mycolicibacterium stellerae TaxID=2358193 RepID=UPI001F235B82|nr:GAF domain-containing protein [Mycolicibacterium stellerae]
MSLLVRPTAPPLWLGIAVVACFIVTETALAYLLEKVFPQMAFGVIFLFGVLVISAGWDFGLAVTTTFVSAAVYAFFHLSSDGHVFPITGEDAVAIVVFLPIALLANILAGQVRLRAAEANRRRHEAEVLAGQQAALRRVATLVARAVPPSEVFSSVADELARCLGVDHAALVRYEPDGAAIVVAAHNEPGAKKMFAGKRFSFQRESIVASVLSTGHPARIDRHDEITGLDAEYVSELGVHSGVGTPIVVGGRLWGAAVVGSLRSEPLPHDTEARVGDFADLVATAIANAETRTELTASRARIVAAADGARRRFERDLHDGAQQRLVSLALALRAAEAAVPAELEQLSEQLSVVVSGLTGVFEDLQEISRGIHPAILSRGGLGPAIKTLARRSAVPAVVRIGVDQRLPDSVEVAAYYVVAEALTNAAKHAKASEVSVSVETDGPQLCLAIRDDGVGGANSSAGSGLVGLADRVEALGGHIQVASPAGGGTTIAVAIPIEPPSAPGVLRSAPRTFVSHCYRCPPP